MAVQVEAADSQPRLNLREFAWALVPPLALLLLWELGKLAARRLTPATAVPAQGSP